METDIIDRSTDYTPSVVLLIILAAVTYYLREVAKVFFAPIQVSFSGILKAMLTFFIPISETNHLHK